MKGSGMGRAIILIVTVALFVLGLSGVALAATPQDIYDDYAGADGSAAGTLEGTYTNAELQVYLDDPTLHQYSGQTIIDLDTLVRGLLRDPPSEFPMTGVELAWMAFGAFGLIGVGVGLRRLVRSRA
jgi:hypothetical protein